MLTPSETCRTIREALGLTQEQMAARLLVSRNYIAQIESGSKEPSARLLAQIRSLGREPDGVNNETLATVSEAEAVETEAKPEWLGPPNSPLRLAATEVLLRGPSVLDVGGRAATAEDCMRYLVQLLVNTEGNPNRIAWIYEELRAKFPLDRWRSNSSASEVLRLMEIHDKAFAAERAQRAAARGEKATG